MEDLKRTFKEFGISQQEIADFVSLSQPLVNLMLNGKVKPTDEVEKKLHELSSICIKVGRYMEEKFLSGGNKL